MVRVKFVALAAVVSLALLPACATKKYVKTRVGEVNTKVETLSASVEETQNRVKQNEQKIGEVDQKAETAKGAADEARNAADRANTRAEDVEKASRKLLYEVVLSSDEANFKFGKVTLPQAAESEIDQLVDKVKQEQRPVFIEVEGYTDSVGPKAVNDRIGMERAEAVKRYLYEKHQIPLHKINVISFGEEKPVAPNNSRDGRAKNRRVVIRVLA